MEQGTLFDLPPKEKKARKPFVKTQQYICKRCEGSVHDKAGAYCKRFDLCLEFDNGACRLTKDNSSVICDGKKWRSK